MPAAFEIESVVNDETVKSFPFLGKVTPTRMAEARDDRFFAAFDLGELEWQTGCRERRAAAAPKSINRRQILVDLPAPSPAFALLERSDVRYVVAPVPRVQPEHLLQRQQTSELRVAQAATEICGIHRPQHGHPAQMQRVE